MSQKKSAIMMNIYKK